MPLIWLTLFLALRFALLALFILFGPLSLSPDEAQYWTWSQDLSYGYYSKPPGIAWQIFLTTKLFGNTEWGVRSSALIIGTAIPLAIYLFCRSCGYDKKQSALTAFTFAIIPIGIFGSLLAVTDGGMLLFWILASAYFIRASQFNLPLNPLALGLLLALGALFKWPIYILGVYLLLWSLFFERGYLKNTAIALLVSLVGLLPSLFWNMSHGFVTFLHVFSSLFVGGSDKAVQSSSNFLDFFGAQFALMSPLLFIFFWIAFYRFVRGYDAVDKPSMFTFFLSTTILIPLLLSFFTKVQANWGDFFYPSGVVFTTHFLLGVKKQRGFFWWLLSIGVALLLVVGLFFALYQEMVPYRSNPFKNTLGWRQIGSYLEESGYKAQEDFLVADSYQNAALLSFYSPGQKRAYFLNTKGRRLNQFSFWPPLKDDKRDKGFFFSQEEGHKIKDMMNMTKSEQSLLSGYFKNVEPLSPRPLYGAYRQGFLYSLNGYNGKEPNPLTLY